MPPRLSLRRLFLYVVVCGVVALLLSNVLTNWTRWRDATAPGASGPVAAAVAAQAGPHLHDASQRTTMHKEEAVEERRKEKPWFMRGGTLRPSTCTSQFAAQFPSDLSSQDRIPQQLMYMPPGYSDDTAPLKKILVYYGLATWAPVLAGTHTFKHNKCPVARCTLTINRDEAQDADAILYKVLKGQVMLPPVSRPTNQLWILYYLESPYHTDHMKHSDAFNWTSTYRHDSDIVAPYERWMYYDDRVKQKVQERNYAANKTRKVAWFVSNCEAKNERLAYATELQKHIPVDIYGYCGPLKCMRSRSNKYCFKLLNTKYKFYLAFENSNCRDYISEKFYVNGLGQNVLPIVMGAKLEDYKRSAPYRSYIHVDEFESPKELAQYLYRLDKNDELYNSYFRWKGTGEFINTGFWCRLCALLHGASAPGYTPRYYEDVNEWWRGNGVCNSGSWRQKRH